MHWNYGLCSLRYSGLNQCFINIEGIGSNIRKNKLDEELKEMDKELKRRQLDKSAVDE